MDEGWKKLPLFVIILTFLNNAYGFKGGDYSNAHHQRGQPSDNILSPRAVQSSVSNVPVPGILSEEVGTSLFTNRPLKRFTPIYSNNLLQFVNGHDSSRHELMSHAQTTPSSSVVSLPLPLNEQHAGSLTSLQGFSGSTTTDTVSVSAQGESTSFPTRLGNSGLSTSDQSSPSSYQETTGAKPAEATLPVFSQENISYSSSSAPGATYASQGSPVELSEGSGQSISPQGEGGHSGLFHSQGTSSHYTPESYNNLSSSGSSQSSSDQSTPSLYSSSSHGSSGSLLEGEVAGLSSFVDLSTLSQETSSNLPASLEVSSQSTNSQSSPSLFMVASNHSDSQSTVPAYPLDTQGSLSLSVLSTQTQGSASTSQGSSGPELSGSSGPLISTQVQSDNCSGMSQSLSTSSRYAPGSLMDGKFGALPIGVSSQSASVQSSPGVSTSTQSRPGTSSRFFAVQGGSGSTSRLSLKPLGILGLYAPASLSKYANVYMSSHQAVYSQPTSSSEAWFGASTAFASQGMTTTYSGSDQPQGTTSQFAPGSPSSYRFVSLSSPQGAATVQSSRKQFTSSYGTLSGSSTPFTLQGSTTYGGSLQPQGTTSRFPPGSQSHPSVSHSSPQGAASQSASVQSSRKRFTSIFTGSSGTKEGSSTPFTLQGSTTYGGSLQPQGTTSRFPPGSRSYPSVSHSSRQGAASQSASVQSSRKLFASTFTGSSGTKEGSSTPFTLQGSTTYGGSLQPQVTTSRFPPGSQSYPSTSLSSPQGAASQSATVWSSRKKFTSSSGSLSGSSTPFTLQGSTTYGGSLQPQGTTSQFVPASPSFYNCSCVSLSSPQDVASVSATVQTSQKQFTSTFTGSSGTQEGSFTPFNMQESTTYGGSLQPQATTSQFVPASPLSFSQGVASQPSQALQSYSVSQRWQPSQGIQTSVAATSQGSTLSQSSPMQSRFSSLSSAGGSSSGYSGQFVSAQGGSTSDDFSLHSQSPSSKYTHTYPKLGSSLLTVSSQSTSDQRSNGLYISDSRRTQGLLAVVERPSRLSFQPPFDSPSSNPISKGFVALQRPTGSTLAPSSLGSSGQASSVSMFSGIPQNAQALRESVSNVQLYNRPFHRHYSVKG